MQQRDESAKRTQRYDVEVEIDPGKASFRDVEQAVSELDGVEFAAVMEVREPDEP